MLCVQFNALGEQHKSIHMVAGLSKPPFIIAKTKKGMQIEIIRAAFSLSNYQVNFIHLPLKLNMEFYKRRNIDGIATLSDTESESQVYLSKPYIKYQNVVVTLAKSNIHINQLSELSGIRVGAFQSASHLLGDKYSNIIKKSTDYIELADQKSQLALLFRERVDAIVMDINIFKYLLIELQNQTYNSGIYTKNVVFHPVFQPKNYVAGFNSKKLQNLFDKGIAKLKKNGQYQAIIDSYTLSLP